MKILLIDPPFYRIFGFYNRYFPIGVTVIGTVLKEAGYDVAVYDADCNDNPEDIDYTRLPGKYKTFLDSFQDSTNSIWYEIKKTIENFEPDAVGIALWTTFAASVFNIARIVKELKRNCPVIVGGPHATAAAEETLKVSPHIDYVVRGEGEVTITELVSHLEGGIPDLSSISGLSYRKGELIIHNPDRVTTKNLDKFPYPDRRLLMNENNYTSEDMGLIMTSRGCPYRCTFCATETMRTSYRTIDNVLEEIRFVKERYGTVQFSFKDDSFTVNRKRVVELCDRLIDEDFRINWECGTRVDLITEDLIKKMKKAGCNSIKVGIESGSKRVLEKMDKGITHDQVRNASRLFKKTGIHWTGYFMMGIPGETVDDIYKTLDFMYEVRPDFASIGVYEPFPGNAMFVEGISRGLVKPNMSLNDFYTTLPNHYYKVDSCRQLDTVDENKFYELEVEIKAKFHRYNNRFTNILRRGKSRLKIYFNEPKILVQDIKKYLSWR